ncbi:MAG: PspA/IM30 family protein [Sphaerochaetaceae bacterium]
MNVFKRMGDIFNANLNSTLDKMEDPQKMINLMIDQFEETLSKARASLAEHKAEVTTLQRQKLEWNASMSRWEERAKMAVSQGKDNLAREALVEKKSASAKLVQCENQLKTLDEIITSQEAQIAEIHDKLEEVKSKQQILVERARSAKEKKQVENTLHKGDSNDIARKFSELESKIEKMEADADLTRYNGKKTNTDEEFSKMENDSAIEAELKALKEKKTK